MKVIIDINFQNHNEVVLTNEKGDTYTSKSEELQDFLTGLKGVWREII